MVVNVHLERHMVDVYEDNDDDDLRCDAFSS